MTIVDSIGVDLGPTDHFYIDGEWRPASSLTSSEVIDPTTESVLFRVGLAQPEDMDLAIGAARQAFDRGPWPRMTHAQRAVYLRLLADALELRAPDVANIWTKQVGMLHSVSSGSARRVANGFRLYADLAESFPWIERHVPSGPDPVGLLVREPVGVCGAIIPWNAPIVMIVYKLAPALLAGCTVVVKMSPESPGEGFVLAQILDAVGMPRGVVNVVTADRDVSELLVRDPRVDKITFTGSTAVGRRIGSIMSERIGRYSLELGGKSPAVVLDDADVGLAARTMTTIVSSICGQGCATLTRAVATPGVYDDLVDALASEFGLLRVGDPFQPDVTLGPVAMERQLNRVRDYISVGLAEGAKLVTGGSRPEGLERGYFIEPTVFASVENSFRIAQEEIFGPVLAVIRADDEQHAVEIANDSIYGLNASVFTRDPERAYSIARQLQSGSVAHNGFITDFGIGFGGFKQSGIGREGGREGLLPFLEAKTIVLNGEVEAAGRLEM
jgi:aldehyde dehydrogenase (NAD+)